MANTNYLTLTNRLLERLNEVTIVEADFPSVRGVQSMAKNVINSSIQQINVTEFEWPFNAATGSQILTKAVEEYAFPANTKVVKWDSFYIDKDDTIGTQGGPLRFISLDEYNVYRRKPDVISGTSGIREPAYVYPKHGGGFGVTPSPDKAYTVKFEYFREQPLLDEYDDVSNIPDIYDEAIIQGALYHFYMFRDNREQAADALKAFETWVSRMRTILINNEERLRDGMLAWNGGAYFTGRYSPNPYFF